MDWSGDGEPVAGDVVRSVTATKRVAGFFRVTTVRLVRTRKELDADVVARYRVDAEFIGAELTRPVDWTLTRLPKRPKPSTHDRFSPLLDGAAGEAATEAPAPPGSEDC